MTHGLEMSTVLQNCFYSVQLIADLPHQLFVGLDIEFYVNNAIFLDFGPVPSAGCRNIDGFILC
jgi:hypothetical protein